MKTKDVTKHGDILEYVYMEVEDTRTDIDKLRGAGRVFLASGALWVIGIIAFFVIC